MAVSIEQWGIYTQLRPTTGKATVQIQIIPPTEEKQPETKQLKPRPGTNRLQVPTRARTTKRKKQDEADKKKGRYGKQIPQIREMPTEKGKSRPENEANPSKKSRSKQEEEKGRDAAEQKKANWAHATQKQEASEQTHRNLTIITRIVEELERDESRTTADKISPIQAMAGRFEASLVEGASSNCPIQKKMKLTRFRISKPPRMMRNIAKYYPTEKLRNQQVLKFDIRNPDPSRQLWNRRG